MQNHPPTQQIRRGRPWVRQTGTRTFHSRRRGLQTGFALALAVRFRHAEPKMEKSPCNEDPARFASLGYRVFRNGIPAWPKDWDVEFKLHAPLGTIIEGTYRDQELVELNVTPESRREDVILCLGDARMNA